jgi:UDP-N-acetyl-D-mannosaminuronic acid dehydrogenase
MKVCVIGLGYIGLPTSAVIASKEISVLGVDINQSAVDIINSGKIHIVEPDLDTLVHEVVHNGFLVASTKVSAADVFIIAVPTPFYVSNDNKKIPNMSYVEEATLSILPYLKKDDLVILESTSPVNSTENVVGRVIKDAGFDIKEDIHIAHCPERVLPGQIIRELRENDRIVGGLTPKATEKAAAFYKQFVDGECFLTNARTAEMAKLVENSYRDVNIAFANELSLISESLDIDVFELINMANKHPRVNILNPGAGVGGHCIAVDPWFIIDAAPEQSKLIHQARLINDKKPEWVIAKIDEFLKYNTGNVALFGLSYKPDIDDLRESPSLFIAENLTKKYGHKILVVEPNIREIQSLNIVSLKNALQSAALCVFLVPHKEFKLVSKKQLDNLDVLDVCGLFKK